MAEDGYIARIASEGCDVVANPFQHGDDIKHPNIGRGGKFLSSDACKVQIAIYIQTVIVGDHDHIVIAGETLAVVGEKIMAAAAGVSSPMHVHHDRAFMGSVDLRRPQIEAQTVLARHRGGRAAMKNKCVLVRCSPGFFRRYQSGRSHALDTRGHIAAHCESLSMAPAGPAA